MRERMFDTIEQRHAYDFSDSEVGKRLYEELLSAVRDCGDTQAAEEFECRFSPLLDPDHPRRDAEIALGEEITKEDRTDRGWRGGWGWVSAVSGAAVALVALFLGFNAMRMKTADRPTLAGSSIPAAHATVSSDTLNDAVPGPAAEAPIAADDATELAAPETMASPAQVPATEQDLNSER
jgi:hypothetical protein